MPTAQIKLGKSTLALSASSDLAALATKSIDLKVLCHTLDIDALMDKPIGEAAASSVQAQIELGDSAAWKPAGLSEALTLSVSAGVGGSLALIPAGAALFQFPKNSDGSDGLVQKARNGDQDCPYIRIGFTVKYAVGGGAQFSFGALGVNASASEGRTFTVDNYFACDAAMPFADAIVAAFDSFILPFNAAHAPAMADGCFLDYVFSGKMAFGAGLNYGVSLAGASLGQLKTSFDSAVVTGGIAPSLKFGASMNVKFEASDAFRVIVGRRNSPSQNVINLCVGKVDKKSLGFDAGVELSAGLGADFNLPDTVDRVLGKAAGAALAKLSEDKKAKALQNFKKALGQDAVTKYVKEAQGKVDGFLEKVNVQKADFTVAYEQSRVNTQLFNYVVNCNVPVALSRGYPAAIRCDFLTAMRTDGIDLKVGSFLDDVLTKKTALTFQFFNIVEAEDVVKFFQDLKTVYAGNGIFRVIFDTGVDWHSVFNGRSEDLKVFFEATSQTSDETSFQEAAITLNFVITDNQDASKTGLTAKALRLLNDADLTDFAGKITETVQVTARVTPGAFRNLKFDPVKTGHHLNSGSHDNDRRNYEVFVANVDAVRPDQPFAKGLRRYEDWVTFNRSVNDQDGSTQPPDREHPGNLLKWPAAFVQISDSATRSRIVIDFEAARQFMNFCEFLDRLDDDTLDGPMTRELFGSLMDSLSSAVAHSPTVLTWYSKACFTALAQLISARVTNIKGPGDTGEPNNISFDLEQADAATATT